MNKFECLNNICTLCDNIECKCKGMENDQYYSSISAEKTFNLQNTTLKKNRSLNNNRKESIKATKYQNNENKTTKCLEETYFGLKKNGLKISHLNIRGVLSKFDEMKLFINQKNNTHIMGICETFLTSNTEDSFISIKGFELERKDRCETNKIPAGVRFTIPFIKLDETKKLLSKLETSKATGLDEVGPFFIKLSSEALAPSITYLINLSILEGVFPENLKLAKVTPIFKNDHVRHINITKQPNKAQYEQKTPTINLTCTGDGNPKPTFKWFRQENRRSILSSTNLYIIKDVVQNNSDVYICEVYNTIDNVEYNAKSSVEIDIVDELWSSKETDSLEISAEYAALVIPVICVVVMSLIVFSVRNHNGKSDKGTISRLNEASVIYSEVNEHTKLKYRLKNNQATSSNPEHADVEHNFIEDDEKVSSDPSFKYNMITGKLEVYSNV
ncbi:unnamed protein product [Mytilus edulis]|uniref:Ig-like domain-containing protein n=1 Tax=Mytilus edulis TaxID=6550 RepID=A0A8S3V562_MYTED|nr:unnamed protein product [Mytilus edulis]